MTSKNSTSKAHEEAKQPENGKVKIIINGGNIKNIIGNAAAFQIDNLTDGEVDFEIKNVEIDRIFSGGKGIIYNKGKKLDNIFNGGKGIVAKKDRGVESKSYLKEKFPTLYNVKFWKQNHQNIKYADIKSKDDIFKEFYSVFISKDQYGAAYLQAKDLKIIGNNGELLIEKLDYIGIDPILVNKEMLNKFQPLENASSNFGEPCSPEVALKIENIKDSCTYLILLEINENELIFLTGRDKCLPWNSEFASWEAYVKSEALNLSNYLNK